MIEKKKSLTRIPKNLVHEKARLKQLHLAALSAGNTHEAQNLERQLVQLEELAQGSRDKGISRENEMFLRVNERNRKMNMVEMREAERRDAVERRKNGPSPQTQNTQPLSSFHYLVLLRFSWCAGGLMWDSVIDRSRSLLPPKNNTQDILRGPRLLPRDFPCSLLRR